MTPSSQPQKQPAPLLLLLLVAAALGARPCAATRPSPGLPMAINTWGGAFTVSTNAAYTSLVRSSNSTGSSSSNGSPTAAAAAALDAVEAGCAACEAAQCDTTVGYGGSPDEACETTLDALVMDGETLAVGAVAGLRRVKNAVGVARAVLERTAHSMLAGDLATAFAVEQGFVEESLGTVESRDVCEAWRRAGCVPNYRVGVEEGCGPYDAPPMVVLGGATTTQSTAIRNHGREQSSNRNYRLERRPALSPVEHDTVSLIAIDAAGRMAAGTSTNGASHKVPGRVGDGPIAGSGSYVDGEAGGCGATGDGDIMMRFLPCYQAVENLRRGMDPTEAAEDAVRRMVRRYPNISSGIVVVDRHGNHGAAASGWTFTYSFRGGDMEDAEVVTVPPIGNPMVMQKV